MVAGVRDEKVYFYNANGRIGTPMSIKAFLGRGNMSYKKIQLIGVVILLASPAFGQGKFIKLKFEAEGKVAETRKAIIVFHAKMGSYIATMKKNRVYLPVEVADSKTLDVQVLWDNQSAIFTSVNQEYLTGIWTIGVDKGPSIDESLVSDVNKGKEILVLYYLKLDPDDSVKVITLEVLR